MIQITSISGSLKSSSSNCALIRAIGQLMPEDFEYNIYSGFGKLPHYSPEIDEGVVLGLIRMIENNKIT